MSKTLPSQPAKQSEALRSEIESTIYKQSQPEMSRHTIEPRAVISRDSSGHDSKKAVFVFADGIWHAYLTGDLPRIKIPLLGGSGDIFVTFAGKTAIYYHDQYGTSKSSFVYVGENYYMVPYPKQNPLKQYLPQVLRNWLDNVKPIPILQNMSWEKKQTIKLESCMEYEDPMDTIFADLNGNLYDIKGDCILGGIKLFSFPMPQMLCRNKRILIMYALDHMGEKHDHKYSTYQFAVNANVYAIDLLHKRIVMKAENHRIAYSYKLNEFESLRPVICDLKCSHETNSELNERFKIIDDNTILFGGVVMTLAERNMDPAYLHTQPWTKCGKCEKIVYEFAIFGLSGDYMCLECKEKSNAASWEYVVTS